MSHYLLRAVAADWRHIKHAVAELNEGASVRVKQKMSVI